MCVTDAAAKEADIARFLRDHPRAGLAGSGHPALLGRSDAVWPPAPAGPSGIPALLPCLLDEAAGPEALRLFVNVLLDGVLHMSAAMPAALPFLLRLAADPGLAPAVRSGLVDLVVVAACLSEPVDAASERSVLLLGLDDDHPERERCRTAFLEHAPAVAVLLDDETLPDSLLGADDREWLRAARALR
ncbi:hypothetical protein [Streptomyces sp. TLI_105]|uniref:hypothetical protein n=1 Tax=Streptomyces sp. TLI_105 TaxID=1881019 RepID=UPI0008982233|nr:hypothetical protein [Streptomyces sp. TLI_105]SEE01873.1 hypothetical protein SAMN05428939_7064 [Streptomyces sp. TLI_105]